MRQSQRRQGASGAIELGDDARGPGRIRDRRMDVKVMKAPRRNTVMYIYIEYYEITILNL